MLAAKWEKEQWKYIFWQEMISSFIPLLAHPSELFLSKKAWQAKLHNRPILTGAYFPLLHYNRPLLHLKPQPAHIIGIILKCQKAWDCSSRKGADRQVEERYKRRDWIWVGVGVYKGMGWFWRKCISHIWGDGVSNSILSWWISGASELMCQSLVTV